MNLAECHINPYLTLGIPLRNLHSRILGGNGEAEEHRKWGQTQACGAGCRDERRSLAVGGCGESLCGKHTTTGEEAGSGCT